jgi:hypothetical protein
LFPNLQSTISGQYQVAPVKWRLLLSCEREKSLADEGKKIKNQFNARLEMQTSSVSFNKMPLAAYRKNARDEYEMRDSLQPLEMNEKRISRTNKIMNARGQIKT